MLKKVKNVCKILQKLRDIIVIFFKKKLIFSEIQINNYALKYKFKWKYAAKIYNISKIAL